MFKIKNPKVNKYFFNGHKHCKFSQPIQMKKNSIITLYFQEIMNKLNLYVKSRVIFLEDHLKLSNSLRSEIPGHF